VIVQPVEAAGARTACAREGVVKVAAFFHVRLRRGAGLGELIEVIERFTPLAQLLVPSAAVAQVGGALRLFGSARSGAAAAASSGSFVQPGHGRGDRLFVECAAVADVG
jgi:hypothetical protein